MKLHIILFSIIVASLDSCYARGLENRQNDMAVDFIFWGSGEGEGHWALDWNSWSWKFIVERSEPIAMRFDSSIDANFDNLLSSPDNFKPAAKTKIIIHGWTENGRADWVKRMADAYFDSDQELNVISVEWSELAKGPEYHPAAQNTQEVGVHVGNFINYMTSKSQVSFTSSDVHIIGFSLGAQVAGKAGATLSSAKVARITGLDPAGRPFDGEDEGGRLDPSDATYVDVMHTSAGHFGEETIGSNIQLGHMDFWPNGGHTPMPGTEYSWHAGGMSHFRATEYFIESISHPRGFRARKADSYEDYQSSGGCSGPEQMMGESANSDGPSGNYYVETNPDFPFAKGQTCTE